jgi:hypothetical protein
VSCAKVAQCEHSRIDSIFEFLYKNIIIYKTSQENVMENTALDMNCREFLELSEDYPTEMEAIVEMLIGAEEELCQES